MNQQNNNRNNNNNQIYKIKYLLNKVIKSYTIINKKTIELKMINFQINL